MTFANLNDSYEMDDLVELAKTTTTMTFFCSIDTGR
jgi:hypothetical protein